MVKTKSLVSEMSAMMESVAKYGLKSIGQKEITKHLSGERLTIKQMAIAKCYDCMGFYSDGRGQDCELGCCPLYPIMPYRKSGEKYSTRKSPMTEEHKEKLRAGIAARSASK
jgi:hypothetical protein